MISEHIKKVKTGKLDLLKYVKEVLVKCKKIQESYNYFTIICEDEAISQAKEISEKIKKGSAGKLAGLIITVKDNICVKDIQSTASSQILLGYKPLFDATVIEKLREEDAIIIGKTTMDAFGFGSFNINVGKHLQIPLHPTSKDRVTGGSSGGSAGITALADFAHVSIAESTGGSIECPAAFCGVQGFCPTYGYLSRHGLISYADSLDKIGLMSKTSEDMILVFDVIGVSDEKDMTSIKNKKESIKNVSKLKIGIIKESLSEETDSKIKKLFLEKVEKIKSFGHAVEEVSLSFTFKYGVPTYYLISMSEASTNLARFSGLRYGKIEYSRAQLFSDYFTKIRTENFNEETKRRAILGTFARMSGYRDDYYIKAAKARTIILEEYKSLFKEYDLLLSPTMPVVAPKITEAKSLSPIKSYMMDKLTVGPNISGMPHGTIKIGSVESLPAGLMIIADHFEDKLVLDFMKQQEELV